MINLLLIVSGTLALIYSRLYGFLKVSDIGAIVIIALGFSRLLKTNTDKRNLQCSLTLALSGFTLSVICVISTLLNSGIYFSPELLSYTTKINAAFLTAAGVNSLSRRQVNAIAIGLLGGSAVIGLLSIINSIWHMPHLGSLVALTSGGHRLYGALPDPNRFGFAMGAAASLLLTFTTEKKKPRQQTYIVTGLTICILATLLSGSRGASLALATTILLFLLHSFFIKKRQKFKMFFLLLFTIVMVTLSVQYLGQHTALTGSWTRLTETKSVASSQDVDARLTIWQDTLNVWQEHPLFGAGYRGIYRYSHATAHNSYLKICAEFGVIGIIIYTIIVIKLLILPRVHHHKYCQTRTNKFPLLMFILLHAITINLHFLVLAYLYAGIVIHFANASDGLVENHTNYTGGRTS